MHVITVFKDKRSYKLHEVISVQLNFFFNIPFPKFNGTNEKPDVAIGMYYCTLTTMEHTIGTALLSQTGNV